MAGKTATVGLIDVVLVIVMFVGFMNGGGTLALVAVVAALVLNAVWFLGVLFEGVRDEWRR